MPRTFKTPADREVWESKILSDFKKQEQSVTQSGQYCQTLCEALIRSTDADMSKTSYRLLNYLNGLYPFSDRYVEMPSQSELALRLGVTRQSINTAQAEIQAAGLWDFRIDRWKGRNLSTKQVSKKIDTCKENFTPSRKQPTPGQKKSTPQTLKPSHSSSFGDPQIYSDLFKQEREREKNNFFKENCTCGKEQGCTLAECDRYQVLESTISEHSSDTLDYTLEDQISVAAAEPENFKTYASFESSSFASDQCNWVEYAGPGFAGSPPEYYVFQRAKVVLLAQERQRQRHEGKRSIKLISDIEAYTRAVIRTGGAQEFEDWARVGRPTEPVMQPIAVNSASTSKAAAPLLTPDQVLENRRRSLMILYESGKFDEMFELLDRWLSLKDGIVPQLLKQCPEWGFALRRDRVVRLEAVEA